MKNFRRVDGEIYAGGAPDLKDLEYLKNNLKIKTVISLDETAGNKIDFWLKQNKINHIMIPMDSGKSFYDDSVKYIVNYIDKILVNGQPSYIHCEHGRDRTGFAVAVYRIKHSNWTYQAAINDIKRFGFGQGVSPATMKLWTNILKTLAHSNTEDILQVDDSEIVLDDLRNTFDTEHLGPTALPDTFFGLREGETVSAPPEDRRREFENLYEKSKNPKNLIPEVGMWSGLGPFKGLGPVENSRVFDFL